jgi:tetratricopeptide (TPR) repeat protein
VLEGSVRRDGQRIRVTAQLIDTRSDSHQWSKTWDRDLADVFQVQQEIAREIADSLEVRFAGPEGGPRSVGTTNVEAYERYLEGRHYWRQRGEGPLRRSIEHFEQAISLDPGFARAHSSLAAATILLVSWADAGVPVGPLLDAGQAHAERALSLDPNLAEAHAVLASILEERWQFQTADAAFRRAVALDPSDSTVQQWYGESLARLGRFRDADVYTRRAVELDPLSPIINVSAAINLAAGPGDTKRALELAERAAGMGFERATATMANIRVAMGDPRSARALVPDGSVSAAVIDALIDPARRPAALARLEQAAAGSRRTTPLESQMTPYIYLGEIDRAYAAAERALADRTLFPADFLATDASPNFARFRADPRFQRLVRDAGLLDYWRSVGWPDLCRAEGDAVVCDR